MYQDPEIYFISPDTLRKYIAIGIMDYYNHAIPDEKRGEKLEEANALLEHIIKTVQMLHGKSIEK